MEENLEADIEALTRMIDAPGLSDVELAQALISRGVLYSQFSRWEPAIADFSRVLEDLNGIPQEMQDRALFQRAQAYENSHEYVKAVTDRIQRNGHPNPELELKIAACTQVIQHPDSTVTEIAQALLDRSRLYMNPEYRKDSIHHSSNWRLAFDDLKRVIDELADVPELFVVEALFQRCEFTAGLGFFNTHECLIEDYSIIIENCPQATDAQLYEAYLNRARCYGVGRQYELAIDDLTKMMQRLSELSAFQKYNILNARSYWYFAMGKPEEAVADCNTILTNLSGLSRNEIASTILERGKISLSTGQSETAIADFNRAVEMQAESAEGLNQALLTRGDAYAALQRPDLARDDYQRIVALQDESGSREANHRLDFLYREFGYPFEWDSRQIEHD